jgi:hypothetical protein
MPRVSVCENLADQERKGIHWSAENDNTDFCQKCYQHLDAEEIAESYKVSVEAVDMGADHPQYEGEDYRCHHCRRTLTGRDD